MRVKISLGEGEALECELPEGSGLVIGREADCDVRLRGKAVSRHHAEMTLCQGRVYVRDLGTGQGMLEREYWLSRRWPFMAVAIRFTDALGRPSLQSLLSGYKAIGGPDGPLAAHRMTLEVGQDEGRMTLSFGELEFRDATPLAFRRPPLGEWPVREIIDLDAEMGTEPR